MIRAAILLGMFLTFVPSGPVAEKKSEPSALERKLHGDWKGGACLGDWTFKADGTYELRHFTPAGLTLRGTWTVRWDALPPTLVLTCKASDDADLVGKVTEVKLIRLDNSEMAYQHAGGPPLRCERVKK